MKGHKVCASYIPSVSLCSTRGNRCINVKKWEKILSEYLMEKRNMKFLKPRCGSNKEIPLPQLVHMFIAYWESVDPNRLAYTLYLFQQIYLIKRNIEECEFNYNRDADDISSSKVNRIITNLFNRGSIDISSEKISITKQGEKEMFELAGFPCKDPDVMEMVNDTIIKFREMELRALRRKAINVYTGYGLKDGNGHAG